MQKRSKVKSENPGLYDKTVGGHVLFGESDNVATIRECAEELGFPASILLEKEFKNAIKITDLKIIGIFKKIDEIKNFLSNRINKNGSVFIQPYISTLYIGYYDGSIRFIDGESAGVEVFSLKELVSEIKTNPTKFTEDIKFIITNYKQHLQPIKKV